MKNNQNAPRIKDPSCEDTKDLLVTEFVFPSKLGLELHEDLLKAPRIKDPNCEDTKDLLVTEFVFPSKLGLELHEDLLKAPRIKDPNCEDTYQNVNISLFEAGKVNDNAEYNPGLLGDSDSGQ